ncbi:MAG: hypothetical protein HQL88_07950 [Magnetococcales bacterium]|nr:hypothetical protein [Magnetococcales bacterium]
MKDHTQEQESALLDLDGLTVLVMPEPENPFQEIGTGGSVPEVEEGTPVVDPEEWLED